jgi:hypothetical protein
VVNSSLQAKKKLNVSNTEVESPWTEPNPILWIAAAF